MLTSPQNLPFGLAGGSGNGIIRYGRELKDRFLAALHISHFLCFGLVGPIEEARSHAFGAAQLRKLLLPHGTISPDLGDKLIKKLIMGLDCYAAPYLGRHSLRVCFCDPYRYVPSFESRPWVR